MEPTGEDKEGMYTVPMPAILARTMYGKRTEQQIANCEHEYGRIKLALADYITAVFDQGDQLGDHPGRGTLVDKRELGAMYERFLPLWRSWTGIQKVAGNFARLHGLITGKPTTAWGLLKPFADARDGYAKLIRMKRWLDRRNPDGTVKADKRAKLKKAS